MKTCRLRAWTILAALTLGAAGLPNLTLAAAPSGTALTPRAATFGNPERVGAQISPEGKYDSLLAPRDGVLKVWVVERGKPLAAARPLTSEKMRALRTDFWTANGKDLVYLQDKGGDESFLLYTVNIATGKERKLTDFQRVRVLVDGSSWKRADELFIAINDRDKSFHDPDLLSGRTGNLRKLFDNTEKYDNFIVDQDLSIRLVARANRIWLIGNDPITAPARVMVYDRDAESLTELYLGAPLWWASPCRKAPRSCLA